MSPSTPTPTPTDVTSLLQSMVRINSINAALPGNDGAESALCDMLESIAQGMGLSCRRIPLPGAVDQLLITHEAAPGQPWLLFDSHLDTVAVDGMTIDPFGGELRDEKIWGRGSCDTKGTGAAMLWALHRYASAGDSQNNIALLFSIDEEVAMTGIQSFVKNDLPALGWDIAGVVVGEPTEHRPVVAHNGCGRWVVRTTGVACHSSVPQEGRSAISAMIKIVDAIESKYIPSLTAEHRLTGPAVCSVNVIRGGDAPNIVPAQCEIEVDRRLSPGEEADDAIAALDAVLQPLKEHDPPIQYEISADVAHPPFGTDHNESFSDAIVAVLRDMKLPTVKHGAPFATHACYFDRAGLPAVVVGPGSPHKAHTKDEWVAVSELHRGVDFYGRLMRHSF